MGGTPGDGSAEGSVGAGVGAGGTGTVATGLLCAHPAAASAARSKIRKGRCRRCRAGVLFGNGEKFRNAGKAGEPLPFPVEFSGQFFKWRHLCAHFPAAPVRAAFREFSGIIDRLTMTRKETQCPFPFDGAIRLTTGARRLPICFTRNKPRRGRDCARHAGLWYARLRRSATSAAPASHFRWLQRAAGLAACFRRLIR